MLIPIPLILAAGADVTPEASVVAALPLWLQFALSGLGLFALSIGASFWSDYVRRLGKGAKPWMLSLSAALNLAAGNPHKAVRAAKAAKEPKE
jgi:hypothetical protein